MRMCKSCILVLALSVTLLSGVTYGLTIYGSDAIYLAGRTDIVVPPAADPWTFLYRHTGDTPEEIQETHPPCVSVVGGAVVSVVSATGGINFFNGYGPPYFPPDGYGDSGSELYAIDGISGYKGPQGPLAGVFLDDSIPDTGPAPATLDFTPSGLGTDFLTLSPQLGQVFYIGDGLTDGGIRQYFMAPADATRLCLGIPDGWGFVGHPGYYDDNDGSYEVQLNVAVDLHVDINPGSCPNPFNSKSQGSIPVAIVGTETFDVGVVDPTTLKLWVDGHYVNMIPGNVEYIDSAEPGDYDPEDCYDCFDADVYTEDLNGDGIPDVFYDGDGKTDLVVKFDTQELSAAIIAAWGSKPSRGTCVVLMLEGETCNGIPVSGMDSVVWNQ